MDTLPFWVPGMPDKPAQSPAATNPAAAKPVAAKPVQEQPARKTKTGMTMMTDGGQKGTSGDGVRLDLWTAVQERMAERDAKDPAAPVVPSSLPEEEAGLARIVAALPDGVSLDGWDDMTLRQQEALLKNTGLTAEQIRALQTAHVSVETLQLIVDVQQHSRDLDLSQKQVNALAEELLKLAQARYDAQAREGWFVGADARAAALGLKMLDEKEAELLRKAGIGRDGASWYNTDDFPLLLESPEQDAQEEVLMEPQPTPYPPGVVNPILQYVERSYDTVESATRAWADEYRPQSKDYEHCAGVMRLVVDGETMYYLTDTYRGDPGLDPEKFPKLSALWRANVIRPITSIILQSTQLPGELMGFIHSHPDASWDCCGFSEEDKMLVDILGFERVWLAAYQAENDEVVPYPKKEERP